MISSIRLMIDVVTKNDPSKEPVSSNMVGFRHLISRRKHKAKYICNLEEANKARQNWLVLSGGLGSSAYVKQRVRAAFPSPRVVIADEDEP